MQKGSYSYIAGNACGVQGIQVNLLVLQFQDYFKLQNICSYRYSFLYSIYSLSAYILLQCNILLILSELCGHQNLYNHELLAYSTQKQGGRRSGVWYHIIHSTRCMSHLQSKATTNVMVCACQCKPIPVLSVQVNSLLCG